MDKSVPEKKVEVHYSWKLDMYIADISYTLKDSSLENWAEIVVFGLKKPLSEKVVSELFEKQIFLRLSLDGFFICVSKTALEVLPFKFYFWEVLRKLIKSARSHKIILLWNY